MAFILAGWIFKGIQSMNSDEVEQSLMRMIWIQNFWITAICIPFIIIAREKP